MAALSSRAPPASSTPTLRELLPHVIRDVVLEWKDLRDAGAVGGDAAAVHPGTDSADAGAAGASTTTANAGFLD